MENKRTLQTSDFRSLRNKGKQIRGQNWLLVVYASDKDSTRFGWTISRRIGNAVIRNRLKRWARQVVAEKTIDYSGLHVNLIFRDVGKDFYRGLHFAQFKQSVCASLQKIRTSH